MNIQFSVVAVVTALGLLLARSDANAAGPPPFQCSNTAIIGQTINGTLVVPINALCTLINVTVNGNVQVQSGGVFDVEPPTFSPTNTSSTINGSITVESRGTLRVDPGSGQKVTINGNIAVDGCKNALLQASGIVSIEGNVNFQNCVGVVNGMLDPQIALFNVTVGGNFTCSGNVGCDIENSVIHGTLTMNNNTRSYEVSGDQVGGNVRISGNTGPEGFFVFGNTISGNLVCNGNSPDPTLESGSSNQVEGHKTGQCVGL